MRNVLIFLLFIFTDFLTAASGIWCPWSGYYTNPELLKPSENDYRQTCVPCPNDTYSEFGNVTECTPCPDGTTTYGEYSSSINRCTKCEPGYIEVNEECEACPKGTFFFYGFDSEMYACVDCFEWTMVEHTTTAEVASSSSSDCVCDIGYKVNDYEYQCNPCPVGWYKDAAGNLNCTRCPEFYTTNGNTSTSVNDCVCAAGHYMHQEMNRCVKCGIGSYSGDGATECTECPEDRTTLEGNSTSASDCVCLAGMFEDPFSKECAECGEGTYSDTEGSVICEKCPRSQRPSMDHTHCV